MTKERQFVFFLAASTLALVSAYIFLITQGWYVMKLTGAKLSIGLSWSIFFIPGALFLPAMSVLFDNVRAKRFVLVLEGSKVFLIGLCLMLLTIHPSALLVYIFSGLLGILWVPFFPATYFYLKKFSDTRWGTRGSAAFEVCTQVSVIVSALGAGFLYERFGFIWILAISCASAAAAFLLLTTLPGDEPKQPSASILSRYSELVHPEKLRTLMSQLGSRETIYVFLHLIPQNLILASTVPLIIYVSDVMREGPLTFGVLDAVYSIGGIGAAMLLASKSWGKRELVLASFVSALLLATFAIIPPKPIFIFILEFLMAFAMVSTKTLARAEAVRIVPEKEMMNCGVYFQLVGTTVLILSTFGMGLLADIVAVQWIFASIAVVFIGFSLFSFQTLPEPSTSADQ